MTGRVLSIHGVADGIDPGRFAFRNLLDTGAFSAFLSTTPPMVPLAGALAGNGTALTIDDATRAGAAAARLARSAGHAVTLFVNAAPVASGTPHFFLLLNSLLDRLDGTPVVFDGRTYQVQTMRGKQALRAVLKEPMRSLTAEHQRLEFVRQLGADWGAGDLDVPAHFATLTLPELASLRDLGVDIQNHGWSHAHHAALTPLDSAGEIKRGREWLRAELGADARWFAVPFGDSLPHNVATDCDAWLTLNGAWQTGWIAPSVFNREELHLTDSGSAPSRWSLRDLVRRISGRRGA